MPANNDATAPRREGRLAGAGLRPPQTSSSAVTAKTPPPGRAVPRRITPTPDALLTDPVLLADISSLPSNYSFEIPKTIHRIRQLNATRVALQMPEGLLMFATTISDILLKHTSAIDTVILGDVTYGACCIDDFSARALSCDFLVHYAHSCLVPVQQTTIPALYVFVHIAFDTSHLKQCLIDNFPPDTKMALVGTIQFVDTVHQVREELADHFTYFSVPQSKPLSPGELLGCTSPKIRGADVLVYLGDGRFHLESAMIANPQLKAYRYDPYGKKMTVESYGHEDMLRMRHQAVCVAKEANNFGVILGTLGRQGSPKILERVTKALEETGKSYVVVLLSEISPQKISRLEESGVQAWVQIACPRLSVDWGHGYGRLPLLTTYEAFVALGKTEWRTEYPMDFYSKEGGEWTNYYRDGKTKRPARERPRRELAAGPS